MNKKIIVSIVIAVVVIGVIGAAWHFYPKQKISQGIQGKTITIADDTGQKVTVKVPIKTIVFIGHNTYLIDTLRALGVTNRIIGINDRFIRPGGWRYSPAYYPELLTGNITDIGTLKSPNYEVIDKLRPDVVLNDGTSFIYDKKKTPGIPVIVVDVKPTTNQTEFKKKVMELGVLFGKEKEAKEYIDWWIGWFNILQDRVKDIPYNKRPLVYIGYCYAVKYGVNTNVFQMPAKDSYRSIIVRMAGGRPMGDEIPGSGNVKVDAEWIISRNPDAMVFSINEPYLGYDIENPLKAKEILDKFLNRPDFAGVKAVKSKKVYMVSHAFILCGGASGLLNALYLAKCLYPNRFADINFQEVWQEYVTNFQHLNLNVSNVWCVYPKP